MSRLQTLMSDAPQGSDRHSKISAAAAKAVTPAIELPNIQNPQPHKETAQAKRTRSG